MMRNEMRLQKFLSSAGFCSRRRGEELIEKGLVTVNSLTASLGAKVDPVEDIVEVMGERVVLKEKPVVIAYNKPKGIVSSLSHKGKTTLPDVIDIGQRIYPIGRLDEDSQGLLLLTNDGRLHHRLLHPSFDHEKEYYVKLKEPIPNGALLKLGGGVTIGGERTRPCKIRRIDDKTFTIVLMEGKNRQIRRMVRKVGSRVDRLTRTRFCNIKLGKLGEGKWRYLDEREMECLYAIAGIPVEAAE